MATHPTTSQHTDEHKEGGGGTCGPDRNEETGIYSMATTTGRTSERLDIGMHYLSPDGLLDVPSLKGQVQVGIVHQGSETREPTVDMHHSLTHTCGGASA